MFPPNLHNLAISLDSVPGEEILFKWLQTPVAFKIHDKTIREGRLLLFRRYHYYIEITLQESKTSRIQFEVPIPLMVEHHKDDNLLYFDYRPQTIGIEEIVDSTKKSPYLGKILEISAAA